MRHLYDKAHLGRSASHRKALFSNMSASLFLHYRIITTLGKARFARRFAERMITFARKGDLAARRHVLRYIRNEDAVAKLFDELGERFRSRNGGYTRIVKLGPRRGDGAPMALIELVGFENVAVEKAETPAKSKARPAAGTGRKAAAKPKDESKSSKPAKPGAKVRATRKKGKTPEAGAPADSSQEED